MNSRKRESSKPPMFEAAAKGVIERIYAANTGSDGQLTEDGRKAPTWWPDKRLIITLAPLL